MYLVSTNKQKHGSANPFMKLAIGRFHGQVRAMLPQPVESLLEVGCGEGYSARAILGDQPRRPWFGGDLEHSAVVEARRRFPAMHYTVFDATKLPFPDASVDAIMSLEVMEHLPDPKRALQEFRRVARHHLVLSVPNDPVYRALRLVTGKGWSMWGDHPEHIQHWSTGQFVAFLESEGVRVQRVVSPGPFAWTIAVCDLRL